VFFIPVVFAASTYPLASVAAVGSLTVASYLALACTVGERSWSYQALFAVMLACAGAMSAWQARNHESQRTALAEISRADPLIGCLNRRGFQERAAGELSAAMRGARQCTVLVLDLDRFKAVNDSEGHAAGDELLCWVAQAVAGAVRPTDAVGRLGGDEFAVLLCDLGPTAALERAEHIASLLGERAPASFGLASCPLDGVTLEDLLRTADTRLYASRCGRVSYRGGHPSEQLSWAATLAHAVDLRMSDHHEHSAAVAELAVSIAGALSWKGETLAALRIAAMLHDVGKVAVPDAILSKPGPLSADEYDAIKRHSSVGAELVSRIDDLDEVVVWIRHSHEHFDGSGYPDGLRGEEIPLASRILLVADAYDAMTSSRPYRERLPQDEALAELVRNAGGQFDPACVDALLHIVRSTPSLAAGEPAAASA
jgi:diguanylate cyclase (GGDEF)-like protein/putative nucleotidyltransferase with HDIG domain